MSVRITDHISFGFEISLPLLEKKKKKNSLWFSALLKDP